MSVVDAYWLSVVDAYLAAREVTPKVRPADTLYVTDLTKVCRLNAYFNIIHHRPADPQSLRRFAAGRVLEEWWVYDVLKQTPTVRVVETQVPAYYISEEFAIHGRADIVCQHDNGVLRVHEVKTAKTCYWMRSPKPEHVLQLQWYLNALGIEEGVLDYLDKTVLLHGLNPRRPHDDVVVDRSFPVSRDRDAFTGLIADGRRLWKQWVDETPPSPCPGWLCDYCSYTDICPHMIEQKGNVSLTDYSNNR